MVKLTPAADLNRLYTQHRQEEGFYLIEWGLAGNINTPVDVLEKLANSPNEYTLRYLKENPATPSHVKATIHY